MTLVHSDELTFSIWRQEQPDGLVLKPDDPYVSEYENKDCEKHVEDTKTVVGTRKSGISPHELMYGITVAGQSKAYPIESIYAAKVIQDKIGDVPIVIAVGPDNASIRVFKVVIAKSAMTFLSKQGDASPHSSARIVDAETDSTWNFQGCATERSWTGHCLEALDGNKDYWFDWMNHHPSTAIFRN